MRKLYSPHILIPLLICILCPTSFAQTADDSINLHIYPYLQYSTPTSIIIKWETKTATIGRINYNEEKDFTRYDQVETKPVKLHEIKLTGLKPATTYHYQVGYDKVKLKQASFTTAPKPGTNNWRLVAYGDNRTYPETHKKIATQVLKLNPSMIIHSGDLVSSGDKYEQWKEQYFDPMRGLAENICVFPSLGNHERNHQHYYDYMSLPDENGESYYSFDYGNAHFIALNSNAGEAPFAIDSPQTQWLIDDLKKHKDAQWKIVFFHHPLFRCHPTRGIEAQRWVWQEVFEEYGIDLVVNGHDHYYQRTYAVGNYKGEPSKGVYHLISGGGGAPNYPIVPKVHAANRRSVHHFTVLDFLDDRIIGRAIDAEGNIFDAFVYDKEAENSPEEFISYEIFEIERDLENAIIESPVIVPDQMGAFMKQQLQIKNPFKHPLKMTFKWEPSVNWMTGEAKEQILEPGKAILLDLQATGKARSLYPLPAASLEFKGPDGKLVFKNDRIVFHPVKLWSPRTITAAAIKKAPKIDGDLADEAWKQVGPANGFLDVQSGEKVQQDASISIGVRKNKLYISGIVYASEKASTSGDTIRDHRYVLRREHVRVHLAVGEDVYSFAVNPKGTLHDSKNGNVKWDSKITAAAMPGDKGWQFEVAIPLKDLDAESKPLRINFVRNDSEHKTLSEYSLTFGQSGLDHRIPMYESDEDAVERFATLKLE